MRCDHWCYACFPVRNVSIHTPTWGVTAGKSTLVQRLSFQSTHLHEVWLVYGALGDDVMNVSIHTPTWGVTEFVFDLTADKFVSIHTPTWGVTDCVRPDLLETVVSIHTPTWGVTIEMLVEMVEALFQSTHLHEVWPCHCVKVGSRWRFNPHTYMRCDHRSPRICGTRAVSIHTPTWGVTSKFRTTVS